MKPMEAIPRRRGAREIARGEVSVRTDAGNKSQISRGQTFEEAMLWPPYDFGMDWETMAGLTCDYGAAFRTRALYLALMCHDTAWQMALYLAMVERALYLAPRRECML